MHETRSLGRDHLAMVVVEVSEEDGWSSRAGSDLREKEETGRGEKLKKEQERLRRGSEKKKKTESWVPERKKQRGAKKRGCSGRAVSSKEEGSLPVF